MLTLSKIMQKAEKRLPFVNKRFYSKYIYNRLRLSNITLEDFIKTSGPKIKILNPKRTKVKQISRLIDSLDIYDIDNDTFFYSLDPYKVAIASRGTTVFDNFTPNYTKVIFDYIHNEEPLKISLLKYLDRAEEKCNGKHRNNIEELKNVFKNPAKGFIDALQRILFMNQFFWQTEHTLVGLGHLDWWLYELYEKDVSDGKLDSKKAKKIIQDFMLATHSNYEYKSNSLIGDTGQIIVLGGNGKEGYKYNELTYLFIDALKELHLPDPKILLRCGSEMPDELFQLAVDCISTGIGSPLLSNDELIIPAMIEFGYKEDDAHNYGVSACWEPLVIGKSFDNNNCSTINFAAPLEATIKSAAFLDSNSIDDLYKQYFKVLKEHIRSIVTNAHSRIYDDDPLNNMLMENRNHNSVDFCKGGASYNNTGFTTVGLSTVVNSLINIEKNVFEDRVYSLSDIQCACLNDYSGYEKLQTALQQSNIRFGSDSEKVIKMTNLIMGEASAELKRYKTKYGGGYKIGFSSPNYINLGIITGATPDGRNAFTPFATHISSDSSLAYTELMCFASKLNYGDNRFNGNVVDFMVSGNLISSNKEKFSILLKNAVKSGVFQTQVNVIDSKTMIDAQEHPEKYRSLIVRVWGFSAYFNDLPKDYQDNLIRRALEAERVA